MPERISGILLAGGVAENLVFLVATSVSPCSGCKDNRPTMAMARLDSVKILALRW